MYMGNVSSNVRGSNVTYIPPAGIWGRVGSARLPAGSTRLRVGSTRLRVGSARLRVGSASLRVGSMRLFGYQYVGICLCRGLDGWMTSPKR